MASNDNNKLNQKIRSRRRKAQTVEERAKGIPHVGLDHEREVALMSVDTVGRLQVERELQLNFVEELMIESTSLDTIARLGRERWPHLTKDKCRTLSKEIERKWMDENQEAKDAHRFAMIERLHRVRRQATDRLFRRPNAMDARLVLDCENQIAKLGGLQAPKQIEHSGQIQQQQALYAVVANLDPEQAAEMLREQRETERLAEAARTMLPALATGTDDEK